MKARQWGSDRRRANRLRASLPMVFVLFITDIPHPVYGQGMLKDISLTGIFFHAPPNTWFSLGHTVDITVAATPGELHDPKTSTIRAMGKVVRLIPPDARNPHIGVALHFLQSLALSQ